MGAKPVTSRRPAHPADSAKPAKASKQVPDAEFVLDGEFVELNQLLKLAGLCESGGAGKMLVAAGGVRVDGKPELRKTAKIRAGQVVSLGPIRIRVLAD